MQLDCAVCVVRDWVRADRESLLSCANNRNVWRNTSERFPHPYTEADADWWFSSLEEVSETTQRAIEVEGRAVGGIGVTLREGEYGKSGRFGYWIGEEYWVAAS